MTIPNWIDKEALVKKLYTDKKVRNGKLRFVFQKGIGQMVQFAPGTCLADGVYSTFIDEDSARSIITQL